MISKEKLVHMLEIYFLKIKQNKNASENINKNDPRDIMNVLRSMGFFLKKKSCKNV